MIKLIAAQAFYMSLKFAGGDSLKVVNKKGSGLRRLASQAAAAVGSCVTRNKMNVFSGAARNALSGCHINH